MSVQFDCFKSINILNADGSINSAFGGGFDFTLFDYLDFTNYGGDKFTSVTSNEELINIFSLLNIDIELDLINSKIVLLTETFDAIDIQAFSNPCIFLLSEGNVINPLDFSLYNSIDVSFFGGSTIFVYSETQLQQSLSQIIGVQVIIGQFPDIPNFICLDKYEGSFQNLPVGSNPIIYLVDNSNSVLSCDFNQIQSIDLSFYGGNSTTFVNSEAAIIAAFSALNINVSITSCAIELLEYLGPAANIPVCFFPIITLENSCNNNVIDYSLFEYVNFTEFGGSWTQISNHQQLVNAFSALNIIISVDNCNIKVLNQPCDYTFNTILPTRQASTVTAVDDNITNCLLVGTDYIFNPTTNDVDSQNQPLAITHINNIAVIPNSPPILINPGTYAQLLLNNNIKISSNTSVINGLENFNYTVVNLDGNSDTATITYCINNIIVAENDYIEFACDSSTTVTVTDNDSGVSPFTITHINGILATPGVPIIIIPDKLTATLEPNLNSITLTSINMYFGMGSIEYTVTNGGATSTGTLSYNINNSCNPCISFGFNITNNCISTCWETLTYNGNPVNNYLVKLRKSDGTFYKMPSGITFAVGNGTFAGTNVFPPNQCAVIESDNYTLYIEFSDFGNNLNCFANGFIVSPMVCGSNCYFGYNGPGGPAAQLAFDVEVGPNTVINTNFSANTVPDGMVIYYNGNPIYFTGNSATCPYISSGAFNSQYFSCLGCNYSTNNSGQTASTIVPYVSGVNTAKVVVFGYTCSTGTVWNLYIDTVCT